MRSILFIILITVLFTSCGKSGPLTQLKDGSHFLVKEAGGMVESIGQAPRKIGNILLGTSEDTDEDLGSLEDKVDANYKKMLSLFSDTYSDIKSLEDKVDANDIRIMTSLQEQYDKLSAEIVAGDSSNLDKIQRLQRKVRRVIRDIRLIKRRLRYNRSILSGLYRRVNVLGNNQSTIQARIADHQARILELENNQSITRVIDPCGDLAGSFDEVILQLADGTFLAYFENRGKRFLTILRDGSYRTTDRQRCQFQVDGNSIISYGDEDEEDDEDDD